MAAALWAAMQAAAMPAPAAPMPIEFDLAKVERPAEERGCAPGSDSEIVVCGRRRLSNDYPFEEMARRYGEKPLRAEMALGGGATGRAYVEQVELAPGQVSKRVMVGIKLPF
jgi:hypothetical protein